MEGEVIDYRCTKVFIESEIIFFIMCSEINYNRKAIKGYTIYQQNLLEKKQINIKKTEFYHLSALV